ncbi:hypothetical protein [Saccharothrix hoggarensis]|uniref:Uncharacterized protein n=1 Tax=Saccharothrix hoggarensis TaxID=913853 RepID=A0ABW3QMN8_9PSEU
MKKQDGTGTPRRPLWSRLVKPKSPAKSRPATSASTTGKPAAVKPKPKPAGSKPAWVKWRPIAPKIAGKPKPAASKSPTSSRPKAAPTKPRPATSVPKPTSKPATTKSKNPAGKKPRKPRKTTVKKDQPKPSRHARRLAAAANRVLARREQYRKSWYDEVAFKWGDGSKVDWEAEGRKPHETVDATQPPKPRAVPLPRTTAKPVRFPKINTQGGTVSAEQVVTNYFDDAKEALEAAFARLTQDMGAMLEGERADMNWTHVVATGKEKIEFFETFGRLTREYAALFEDKPAITGAFGETLAELGQHVHDTGEKVTEAIDLVNNANAELVSHVTDPQAGYQIFNAIKD